jgi:hypothetical protein
MKELDATKKQEHYSSSRRFDIGEIINVIRGGRMKEFFIVERADGQNYGSWKYDYIIEPATK